MFRSLLASKFPGLSEEQLAKLEAHYKLLLHWNEKINLTRIHKLDEIVNLHYVESLLLGQSLPAGPLSVLDVGSGAGFPGIPLAILRPDCSVDLAESHQRKAVFLCEASRGLPNVRVLPQRAETLTTSYDWIVSRAVDPKEVLSLPQASDYSLLISAADARALGGSLTPLPTGAGRVLSMFHVERSGT